MSKFIISSVFILLFKIAFSQSSCLKDIKEGKFTHFSNDGEKTLIIRKKGKQTEYLSNGKNRLYVKWIKEDEYLLEERKNKNGESRIVNEGSIIHVKIIGCHEDYYDFTVFLLDEDGVVMEEVSARYYRGKR